VSRSTIPLALLWTELGHGLGVPQGKGAWRLGHIPGWTSRGIDPLRRPVWDALNHTRRFGPRQWIGRIGGPSPLRHPMTVGLSAAATARAHLSD
jgi:hypothetical protein